MSIYGPTGMPEKPKTQERRTDPTRDQSKGFYYSVLRTLWLLVKRDKLELSDAVEKLKEDSVPNFLDATKKDKKDPKYIEIIDEAAKEVQKHIEAEEYQSRL